MLKLELDWAGDEPAPVGVDKYEGEPTGIFVELVTDKGPAGWPVIAVYVAPDPNEQPYMAHMRLQGWLRDNYLVGMDEDDAMEEADELARATVEV